MTRAFVGLGSNVGDRLANLVAAVAALTGKGVEVTILSSVYETVPVGPPQAGFLNAAAEVRTDLSPQELVKVLKQIEEELGREAGERWGPRVIDLDLLLYGERTVDEPELKVPHAEFTNRAFALVPVLEIDPDVELPSGEPLSAFCEKNPPGIRLAGGPGRLLGVFSP
ncbi:MAG: 2-amino-4-hydroxy-6-hydroxymethyldihydropteridine diphosphokinase [Actinomycetota bacterium]